MTHFGSLVRPTPVRSLVSALMIAAAVLPDGHLTAMAAVAVLAFCERLEDSALPRWKMRGLGTASRMIAAQLRIHGQNVMKIHPQKSVS